jgi:hypothetical protein
MHRPIHTRDASKYANYHPSYPSNHKTFVSVHTSIHKSPCVDKKEKSINTAGSILAMAAMASDEKSDGCDAL